MEDKAEYNIEQHRKEQGALRRFAAMMKSEKDIVGCQKTYVDITGDLEAAFVLDELLFFTLPQDDKKISALRVWKNGVLWMAVSRSDWWDRKRLKKRQADLAIQKLLDQELIIKGVWKFNRLSCVHLRLNIPVFFKKYFEALEKAHPPEDTSDTITHDLADLYEMMGMGELQIGDSPELQNGELQIGDGELQIGDGESPNRKTFNNPHPSLTHPPLDPRWDFSFKGDYTQYPQDIWEYLIEFCLLWNFPAPPFKEKNKKGRGVFWLEGLRELQEACGEFGVKAIVGYRKEFEQYMQEHNGLAPFTVNSPKSLVNVVAGHAAKMRNGELQDSEPEEYHPEYERFVPDDEGVQYAPPPKVRPNILRRAA